MLRAYVCGPPEPVGAAAQVGDGTTTVVLLAGEFLKAAKPFIEDNVHPQVRSPLQACAYQGVYVGIFEGGPRRCGSFERGDAACTTLDRRGSGTA